MYALIFSTLVALSQWVWRVGPGTTVPARSISEDVGTEGALPRSSILCSECPKVVNQISPLKNQHKLLNPGESKPACQIHLGPWKNTDLRPDQLNLELWNGGPGTGILKRTLPPNVHSKWKATSSKAKEKIFSTCLSNSEHIYSLLMEVTW